MLGTEDGADTRKGWKVRKGESQVPEEGMFLFFLVFFLVLKALNPQADVFSSLIPGCWFRVDAWTR